MTVRRNLIFIYKADFVNNNDNEDISNFCLLISIFDNSSYDIPGLKVLLCGTIVSCLFAMIARILV